MDYVNGFMIEVPTQEVLFIKKNRPEFQAGKWNGIGGKIEAGETPHQAMVREFEEETGVMTDRLDWEYTILLQGTDSKGAPFKVHFFRNLVEKFPNYHSVTDELVASMNYQHLYSIPTLENMRWVLPLQFSQNIAFPLIVNWKQPN